MKSKNFVIILMFVFIISTMPVIAQAAYSPPATFGAPQNAAVSFREDGFDKSFAGFDCTVTASNELRKFVDDVEDSSSAFNTEGYRMDELLLQLDYKVDNGNWHYQSNWDSDYGYNTNASMMRIESGTYTNTAIFDHRQFESISGGESLPQGSSYFDAHTWQLRARFVVIYKASDGNTHAYFSNWSQPVSYSNKQTVEDPDMLINHAPILKSAIVTKSGTGSPLMEITADKPHADLEKLNAISNGHVGTEIWLKSGGGDWQLIHSDSFVEHFTGVNVLSYFGLKDSYDATIYNIKVRYSFSYTYYPAAGKSGIIYSPFSNVISHGTSAWSNASQWAKEELEKADNLGLIPSSLKGGDMTKPITREEFAELSILLYEKATGKASSPVSPNPFKDTSNPQILKAYNTGIVKGTAATTFSPKELTNREQVATMLGRAIRVIAPNSDFSTAGAPVFSDQKDISNWALEHVLYMAKLGIIKGSDGKFMPKATTTAQTAAGYATTTREQALAMSVRTIDKMDTIQASKSDSAASNTGKSITGAWDTHIATGTPQDIHLTYIFNSNGTYHYLMRSTYDYSCNAYKGNYKIDGDQILFTNVSKILFNYDKPDYKSLMAEAEKAGYKAAENNERVFEFVSGGSIKIDDLTFRPVKE